MKKRRLQIAGPNHSHRSSNRPTDDTTPFLLRITQHRNPFIVLIVTLVGLLGTSATPALATDTRTGRTSAAIIGMGTRSAIDGQYIVRLKNSTSVRNSGITSRARKLASKHHAHVMHVYDTAVRGFSAKMREQDAASLAADPDVEFVEQDQLVRVSSSDERVPYWGLDRIDQRKPKLDNTYTYGNIASNVHAYVLDTGIRTSHRDFNGRASVGFDAIGDGKNGQDCHGHGTHVAGTIGGKSYGVAKGVQLVAVRVLGCNGFGSESQIIAGINWVSAHAIKPAVANMSVEIVCDPSTPGPCSLDQTLHAVDIAMGTSISSGVTYVVAAGNQSTDACTQPMARNTRAITVGATDASDARASFSNYGPCVSLWAPGDGITSAGIANDTDQATLSGTSMAAPHATGAVALLYGRNSTWAKAFPDQVHEGLISEATHGVVSNLPAGITNYNEFLYTLPPPIAGGASIAAARNADGRLSLIGVNNDGKMWLSSQTSPGATGSNSWSDWSYQSNSQVRSVAMERNSTGKLEEFSLSNTEYQTAGRRSQSSINVDQWSSWGPLTDTQTTFSQATAGAVAKDSQGRLVFVGVNSSGEPYYRTQSAPGSPLYDYPSMFSTFSPGTKIRSLAAETDDGGRLHVFGIDVEQRIWHIYEDPARSNGWSPWFFIDGQLTAIAVVKNKDGRLEIYGTNPSGELWRRQQASDSATGNRNNWNGWSKIGDAASTGVLCSVAAETNSDGRIEVFSVNKAGQVRHHYQNTAGADAFTTSMIDSRTGTLRPGSWCP